MRKLTELWVSVDNKGAYDSEGKLLFDDYDQGTWVLWPDCIDDGVSYFDSLKDTEEAIASEAQSLKY